MIEIFAAIIGVVVGWALNEITDSLHKKPKLCFRMVSTPTNELTDKEYRTKTSLSESGIEVFNIGEKPVILNDFTLTYRDKILVDCFIEDSQQVIAPYQSVIYTLTEQEADALQWHCNQAHFKTCDVEAHGVDGKQIKSTLSVSLFYIRSNLHAAMPSK